jgi:hypothetical protein
MPFYSLQNNQKPRSIQPIVQQTVTTTSTVASVSGVGEIKAIFGSRSGAGNVTLTIDIDGVTASIVKAGDIIVGQFFTDSTMYGTFNFKRGFTVTATNAATSLIVQVAYELE